MAKLNLANSKCLLIDTNCFIYFLEDGIGADFLEEQVFQPISQGSKTGIMSVVSLIEIIVKPLADSKENVVEDYISALTNYPNLDVVDISLLISLRAARLRVNYSLKTPDAIIAATAIEAGADAIITNDERFTKLQPVIKILLLDDLLANYKRANKS